MDDVFHPDTGILKDLRIFHRKLSGHNGHIHGCRIVSVGIRQSATILEMCIHHSQFCRLLIHLIHESLFTPRYVFCHRHTGIVAGSYSNTFDHGLQGLYLVLRQEYLGASHGTGVSTDGHRILQFYLPLIQCLECQ